MTAMFADLTHPNREQLRSFVTNRLDQVDMALIRNHLRICTDCQGQLQRMNSDGDSVSDTFNALAESANTTTTPILSMEPGASLAELPLILANHPRFNVISMLGSGAMGMVYRAVDQSNGQFVAIKVLQNIDSQSFQRFKREVELLSKLSHPNLVTLYEANLAGEMPYLVMECVEGISLDRLLIRKGILRVPDACEIIYQVAVGLLHAHNQNVIHRDIKPSNIMVTPNGNVKLLDWGLARIWEGVHVQQDIYITVAHQAVGTPDYIAPEQLEDSRSVDARADIYSLGGTLFTLLTGKAPRDWRTGNAVAYQWLQRPDVTVTAIRADTKSSLRRILIRMLELRRDKRISSTSMLLEMLAPFCKRADLKALMTDDRPYNPLESPEAGMIRVIMLVIIALLIGASLVLAWLKQP
ncbi:MAG TPA: serine/threonine-protein kinase [Gemmatales bacterium]|nr:serine/threonine-protein kinase [Gemmatales bacterium]